MAERMYLSRRDLLRLGATTTVATLASCVRVPAAQTPSSVETPNVSPNPEPTAIPTPEASTYNGATLRWGSTADNSLRDRVAKRNFEGGISPHEIESALMGIVEVHLGEIFSFPFGVRSAAMVEEEQWLNPDMDRSSPVSKLALSGSFLGGKIPAEYVKVSYINMGTGETPPGTCNIDYTSPLPDGTPSLNDWNRRFEDDHLGIVVDVLDNSGQREIYTDPIYSNPLLGPLSWGINAWYDMKYDRFGLEAFKQLSDNNLDGALGYVAQKVNNLKSMTIYPVQFDIHGNAKRRTLYADEFSA